MHWVLDLFTSCFIRSKEGRSMWVENEANQNIMSVMEAIRIMEVHKEKSKKSIADTVKLIKHHMDLKDRNAARNALTRKHMQEERVAGYDKKIDALHHTIMQLEDAAINMDILKIQGDSTKTLQTILKQSGGVTNVTNIMDKLRETMEDVSEVGTVTSESVLSPITQMNEHMLDDELDKLMNEGDQMVEIEIDDEPISEDETEDEQFTSLSRLIQPSKILN